MSRKLILNWIQIIISIQLTMGWMQLWTCFSDSSHVVADSFHRRNKDNQTCTRWSCFYWNRLTDTIYKKIHYGKYKRSLKNEDDLHGYGQVMTRRSTWPRYVEILTKMEVTRIYSVNGFERMAVELKSNKNLLQYPCIDNCLVVGWWLSTLGKMFDPSLVWKKVTFSK